MISAGSYILSAAELAILALAICFSAVRLRARLLPAWEGAPARLVEAIVGIALLIWLSEALGAVGLFYAWTVLASSVLLAAIVLWKAPASPAGGTGEGGRGRKPRPQAPLPRDRTRSRAAMSLIAIGVIALVFAHWGLTTKDALDRGIFNFDSLWYHLPFAVDMVQSHSVTGLHYTDTVFTNWFYPQNSEAAARGRDPADASRHAFVVPQLRLAGDRVPVGLVHRAALRPRASDRRRGSDRAGVPHAGGARAGAAKNDLAAAAPLLAAIAILVTAWSARARATQTGTPQPSIPKSRAVPLPHITGQRNSAAEGGEGPAALSVGWPLAAAGLAVGLAVGTKVTVLAMAAALSVTVVVLAPAGRRRAAAGWWFVPALLGGGFWYLRNLIVAGNPLPEVAHLGPISLPHPERLQTARPDFSIAHYATDTGVWRDYFAPGLHQAFGALWPLVIGGAILGALMAMLWGPGTTRGATLSPRHWGTKRCGADRIVRWVGGVALFGMVAYLFTPLSAAGAEGAPDAFAINIRYLVPALLVGLVLLPLAPRLPADGPKIRLYGGKSAHRRGLWEWALLAGLLAVLVFTDRSDAVLRDPSRVFGVLLAALVVLVPAALLYMRSRGVARGVVMAGFAVLALAVVALGYPIQRHYLRDRFRNDVADTSIPGMHLDSAYRWARGVSDARIGLAGTTAGFLQYGFYGTDLSNHVVYLGAKGPRGAFNAIPTCRAFRAAVNDASLDYLVTAPFLNFIHTDSPIASPEAGWLRDVPAVAPIGRSGPVTAWRVRGRLDQSACTPANAPLRRIPNPPGP